MTIFEFEDIENVLRQHVKIRQAAVQATLDQEGILRLVGYIVPDGSFDRDEVRGFLTKKIPTHRIPSIWVEMDHLPLSIDGNINKEALPSIDKSMLFYNKNADFPLLRRDKFLEDADQTEVNISSSRPNEEALAYWTAKLQDNVLLRIPTDFPRPPVKNSRTENFRFSFDPALTDSICTLGQKQDATLFMTLLAAFKVLLHRYTGQEDICIGTPIAGRDSQRTEGLSGYVVNSLALRTQINISMEFDQLLMLVRDTVLEAFEFRHVPLDKVVESLGLEREKDRNPLFETMFVLQDQSKSPGNRGDLPMSVSTYLNTNTNFDLTFELTETQVGLQGKIEYSTDLYTKETIQRLAGHYSQLLQAIVQEPKTSIALLPLLLPEEKNLLLGDFSSSQIAYPKDKTIVHLFEEHAALTPDAVALVFENEQLTYQELNEKANQLAHYLKSQNVQKEALVPICMERSMEMIIGMVGIMKAGAAYVPVDPAYPKERIHYLFEDTKAEVVLTNKASYEKLKGIKGISLIKIDKQSFKNQPTVNPTTGLLPNHLVYVIYTSGSTGNPKGVMIEHGQLMDHCFGMIDSSNLAACTSFALTFPLVFDAGHSIVHSSIVLGATLHVLSDELILDGEKLSHYLTERDVDCMKIVPSLWQSYAEEQQFALSKKVMVFGGEPLPPKILSQIGKTDFSGEVYNHYGPTETAIGKCIYRVDYKRHHHIVPIGRPYSNTQIYIIDHHHQLVPLGVAGQLCIAGEGVGRGYLNQPGLSAEKFIANPFSCTIGSRMYLTGDLARWNCDGNIECLGRIDDQVKIRGFRIELGEIEAVMQQHFRVKRAAVVVKEDHIGNKRLVGYILPDGDLDKNDIIGFIKDRLPEFMVPSFLEVVDRLPLTFNGKINKKALPEVEMDIQQGFYQPPHTAYQKQLAVIWEALLGIEKIGIHENFFALGGHSLLAMRAVASIRRNMELDLSIRDLFALPTIKQLAERLEKQVSIPQQALSTGPRPDRIPLSYNQQSLWLIHKLEGSIQYHLPLVLEIKGTLDVYALSAALQTIVNRHEVLRTVIKEEDGQGYQMVLPPDGWRLEVVEQEQCENQEVQDLIERTLKTPFDLEKDYMLRTCLIRGINSEYMLVIALHHIASDGWSSNLLKKELVALYDAFSRGGNMPLDPLPFQYPDFSIWQRTSLQEEVLTDRLPYWMEKLRNTAPLQMPTDFPRPLVKSSRGATLRFSIDPVLSSPIRTLGQKNNATMFMILLAAFKVLLYRYTSQKDLCVGTPTAGRDRQETENLMGYFVNTLALRTQVDGSMGFRQLLQAVRDTALEAFEAREVPFEKVVEALGMERDISRNPLFETMFVLQNQPKSQWKLTDLTLAEASITLPTSTFDLTFELTESKDGIHGKIEYCTDIFRQDTIERMGAHYRQLLQAIVANPEEKIGQLNLLTAEEEKQLVYTFNAVHKVLNHEQTILDLFEQNVLDTPNAIALVFGEKQLTYRELNGKANQLGRYLRSQGVKKESKVPICLDGSLEMIIGILGILKAGGAYVPIDPSYPKERIDFVLEDTDAEVVLTNRESKPLFAAPAAIKIIDLEENWNIIAGESQQNLTSYPAPNNLAYVIYTSGSTGKPKGVMIEHRGLASSSQARESYYRDQDSMLLIPSFAFDSSVAIIFGSLTTGGRLIVCRRDSIKNPEHLKILLKETRIILCVPSYYRFLLDEGYLEGSPLLKVILAGENLDESLVKLHYAKQKNVALFNEYGPTEGSVWATVAKIIENEKVTIGKPIENTSIYIVGKEGGLNPIGIPGELCIAGNGLARGYLKLGELTEEMFVPNPFNPVGGSKMYRTGDLARWLPDGQIEYLGRLDDQVKIRGYRIELGEIEAALKGLTGIKDAAVLVGENPPGNFHLTGYMVRDHFLHFESSKVVGEKLGEILPEYMIPVKWAWLDALPLTHNGKVDKKALSRFQPEMTAGKRFVEPKNQTEVDLILIWKKLLQRDPISTNDDFFVLGGHSLLAVRVIAAIRKQMGVEIGIKALFSFPTIAGLAEHLSSITLIRALAPLEKTVFRPDQIPLSYNQESLWFIDQLEGSTQYHLPTILRLRGELDEQALGKTLMMIVERHEVLRTILVNTDGKPWQQVKDVENWTLEKRDLFGKSPDELKKYIESLIARPFDLSEDFMLRADLIRVNQLDHILVMVMHHIASDGWSVPILLNELQIIYEAIIAQKTPELLPLPVQYVDYALWQRNHLMGPAFDRKLNYWKEKLRSLKTLQLPAYHGRPTTRTNNGNVHKFLINKKLKEHLSALSTLEGSTLFMTLLTSFKILLHHFCQEKDICVGTASAGRQQQETEGLIGYFINPLPIRTLVENGDRFFQVLKSVKTNMLEAFENQEVPFEKMVAAISSKRELGQNPLFQVMFVLQNVPETRTFQLGPLQISKELTHSTTSKFDLTFNLTETTDGVEGTVEFNTDLIGEETISHLAENYVQLLASIVLHPDQKVKDLKLQTGKDAVKFPEQDFSPVVDFPAFKPVHRLIEDAAQKFGAKTAIFCENTQCTYATLNTRANQMAHFLIKEGILPGDVVGIYMDRSIDMIVALLGTLKAGGAYLPIDTDYPEGRVDYMLKDAAKMHITSKDNQDKFTSASREIVWEDFLQVEKLYPETNPLLPADPDGAAYVIYTSGSTGRPKGVVIEHRQLFNFLVTATKTPGIAQGDRFLAVSSVSFDIAILEMLMPYVHGAQCYILDKYQRKDPSKILEVIEKENISLMFATPTHWKMILDSGWKKPLDHLSIISGGEALTIGLADRLLPLCKSLWNIYGPTETTVFSTIKEIKNLEEGITIGKPVLNTNIYILDENRNPVKTGTEGEMYISGGGVARHYLNQPQLTKEKFLPDPFHPEGNRRMYMTGDRGKYLPNGEILILGRKDHQVKLRGYRIELGEVEHALNLLDHVKESIAGVQEIGGHLRLIGYMVLSGEEYKRLKQAEIKYSAALSFQPSLEQVKLWKRQLSNSLPSFMVPDDFMVIDHFPLTASGKTDRKNLPAPGSRLQDTEGEILPDSKEERMVADIWSEALGISSLSVTDNFFEIGGHSLIAVQVMTRLEKESGVKLPLSILFKYPTVQQLAAVLCSNERTNQEWDSLVPIRPKGNKPPFYIVHGGGLNVLPFYSIAKNMDPEQPVYGLQAKGLNGTDKPLNTIEEIAAHYVFEIVSHNPKGPYALAGYSLGGIIAFEMAKQLKSAGKKVKDLIMFDTYAFRTEERDSQFEGRNDQLRYRINKRLFDFQLLWKHPLVLVRLKREALHRKISWVLLQLKIKKKKAETPIMRIIKKVENIQKEAGKKYVLTYYDGPIHLLRAKIPTIYVVDHKHLGWKSLAKEVRIRYMEGEHTTMFSPPNDRNFAQVLQEILDSEQPENIN